LTDKRSYPSNPKIYHITHVDNLPSIVNSIKEGKQAEFLMFDVFPWELIHKIGTIDSTIETKVKQFWQTLGISLL
jgi:hypothetical protein